MDNFIEKYAIAKNKAVIYFRSYGWNNSDNVDAINDSMSFYEEILPKDIFSILSKTEFAFAEVEDVVQAVEFLRDNFPKTQDECQIPEYYIHYSLYNDQGQIILSNE